jgi:hypothetical protein
VRQEIERPAAGARTRRSRFDQFLMGRLDTQYSIDPRTSPAISARVGLCQNDHIEPRWSDERRALPDVSARHTERHRVVQVKMPL